MKKILLTLMVLCLLATVFRFITIICLDETKIHDPEIFYINIDLKIVLINSESSLSNDKFHNPQLCNTVLFETLTEPKLYWEYNTCEPSWKINIDTKWLYNHRAGDTVHFDYLRKDHFFTIDKDRRP